MWRWLVLKSTAKVCLTYGKPLGSTSHQYCPNVEPKGNAFGTKVCNRNMFLGIIRGCSSLEDHYDKPVIQNWKKDLWSLYCYYEEFIFLDLQEFLSISCLFPWRFFPIWKHASEIVWVRLFLYTFNVIFFSFSWDRINSCTLSPSESRLPQLGMPIVMVNSKSGWTQCHSPRDCSTFVLPLSGQGCWSRRKVESPAPKSVQAKWKKKEIQICYSRKIGKEALF